MRSAFGIAAPADTCRVVSKDQAPATRNCVGIERLVFRLADGDKVPSSLIPNVPYAATLSGRAVTDDRNGKVSALKKSGELDQVLQQRSQVMVLRFRSQIEKHELSHLYEAKIKNMGERRAQSTRRFGRSDSLICSAIESAHPTHHVPS